MRLILGLALAALVANAQRRYRNRNTDETAARNRGRGRRRKSRLRTISCEPLDLNPNAMCGMTPATDFLNTHEMPLEFLDAAQTILSEWSNRIPVDRVLNHGCWCSKLSGTVINGGKPIDDLDRICKSWFMARKCIKLSQGACEFGATQDVYRMKYSRSSGGRKCESNKNDCLSAVCQIDIEHILKIHDHIVTLALSSGGIDNVVTTSVNEGFCSNDHNGSIYELICVGQAPEVEIVKK